MLAMRHVATAAIVILLCFLFSTTPVAAQKIDVELTAGKLLEETTYPSTSSKASIAVGYTFYRGASIWGGAGLYIHDGRTRIYIPNYSWHFSEIHSIPLALELRYTVGSVSRAELFAYVNGSLLPSRVVRGLEGEDTIITHRFRSTGRSVGLGWGVSLEPLTWLRLVSNVTYEYTQIPLNDPYKHLREGIRIDAGIQFSLF